MNDALASLRSVDNVVTLTVHRPSGPAKGWVLVEVPHGATRTHDYDAVATKLKGTVPAQLDHFFYVNTDIGAPEGAQWLAHYLPSQGLGVVVARCLIPRTFIDTNRVIAASSGGAVVDGLTPAVPGYLTDRDDAAWLTTLHVAYHQVVKRAYEVVCGELNGLAVQLHSYAPRSVGIEKTDANIVNALHAAYQPEVYATWPQRPAVDLISATTDGAFRTNPALTDALQAAYVAAGIEAKQNATYHLHPVTMGFVYAQAWPNKVLCLEWNRGLVADPFTPFGVSPISAEKVARLSLPLCEVLVRAFA